MINEKIVPMSPYGFRVPTEIEMAVDETLKLCGISGEDASMIAIEVMKKLGKSNEIPACCGGDRDAHTDHNKLGLPLHDGEVVRCDENKWIKCSERLPEKEGEYLTTIGKSHPVVRALFYGDPFAFPNPTEWFFYCEHGYGIDRFKAGTEVIAWMPLPDPIEEENNELDTM